MHQGAQPKETILIFRVSHQGTLVPSIGEISTEPGWSLL